MQQIKAFKGALWGCSTRLEIQNPNAAHWAYTVGSADEGASFASIQAFTVAEIMDRFGEKEIDLLKIDIEGAEKQVFTENVASWIDRINAIVIELHDRITPGCSNAFYSAITHRKFIQEPVGEHVFINFLD